MARITADQWADARARREAGASFREIAEEIGCTAAIIHRKAKAENWGDGSDIEEVVRRKAAEKVNGVVNSVDPVKKAAAVEAAADRMAAVVERHKTEWDGPRGIAQTAVANQDQDAAKLAKITAETLKIIQEGERKAWGLDSPAKPSETKIDIKNEVNNTHHVVDAGTAAAAAKILAAAGVVDGDADAGGSD